MKHLGSLVLTLTFAATVAHASFLPPGSGPVPPDIYVTPVTGPFLATIGGPFSTSSLAGTYSESVYMDPSNVFCANCLDFIFSVSSTTSTDFIGRITQAPVGTFLTDVGFTIGAGAITGGLAPNTVDRLGAGNVIGFNFSSGIPPGFSTESLEIQTNATNFTAGTLQIIDGSVASVSVFAPTVPLPASVWLMLSGLVGVGAMARKRRAA
jgi:hypothetical protein